MRAIYQRELTSYFNSISGYIFGAFLLLFAGIYCMAYNLQASYVSFEYVMGSMSFVFLVIVPVLTMRVLAEERRQKTDQLLYSLPLTMTKVVLGKFFAMLSVFVIPLLIISLYPIILSSYGNVHLLTAFCAIAGFFLLGASLLAIGMYISSVTESQAVAAGLCFIVMLVNYFIADLAGSVPDTAFASFSAFIVVALIICMVIYLMTKHSLVTLVTAVVLCGTIFILYTKDATAFEGLFGDVLSELSLFERFYGFIEGIFDLTSVVYYIAVTAVFLYLSVQSLEKRRWSE